jgi:hypothetical protein
MFSLRPTSVNQPPVRLLPAASSQVKDRAPRWLPIALSLVCSRSHRNQTSNKILLFNIKVEKVKWKPRYGSKIPISTNSRESSHSVRRSSCCPTPTSRSIFLPLNALEVSFSSLLFPCVHKTLQSNDRDFLSAWP